MCVLKSTTANPLNRISTLYQSNIRFLCKNCIPFCVRQFVAVPILFRFNSLCGVIGCIINTCIRSLKIETLVILPPFALRCFGMEYYDALRLYCTIPEMVLSWNNCDMELQSKLNDNLNRNIERIYWQCVNIGRYCVMTYYGVVVCLWL